MITLKEAKTKREIKRFVLFPFSLYRKNKYWVPPIIKDEIDNLYLEKTLEKINDCVEDGFELRDIALLVDKNKFGLLLSDYLVNKGYSVLKSESLLLAENKEVDFLVNFLKFVQNNKDNHAKLGLIKFFFSEEKFSPALLAYSKKNKNKVIL